MQRLLILIIFLSIVLFFRTANARDIQNVQFDYLSQEHGLSQKSVEVIYQDSVGFLWIGTQEGLNKYDGRTFKVMRHNPNNPGSISHDFIRSILEDSFGNIWVATEGGLNLLRKYSSRFTRVQLIDDSGKYISRFNTVIEDLDGRILLGTDEEGVVYFELDSKRDFNEKIKAKHLIPDEKYNVKRILKDSRGRLWIGTDKNGIILLSTDNQKYHFINDKHEPQSLSHNQIRSIIEDHKGQIWIGTRGGGVNRFNELMMNFSHFRSNDQENSLGHDRVYSIFEDSKNRVWIGTDDGISLYQPDTSDFLRIKNQSGEAKSLSANRVLSIYEDASGVVWFGTVNGLNKWNPVSSLFSHYKQSESRPNTLSHNIITGFSEDNKGGIFISTFGGGLNYLSVKDEKRTNIEKLTLPEELESTRLMCLLFDSSEILWMGTRGNGAFRYDLAKHKVESYKHNELIANSLSANGVTDIFKDSDGEIWIATYQQGLNRLNKNRNGFKHYQHQPGEPNSISSNQVFDVTQDEDGYIWIATDGGGISRFDKNTETFLTIRNDAGNSESLSGDIVWSIFEDSKGRFWIGTQSNGLNRWEPSNRRRGIAKFKRYTINNGLVSSSIYGVLEDEQGFLWLSSNRGVSRLDPETDEFKHYNLADEFHENEFNQGAFLKASDGRMYFGGLNGVSAFYPSEIRENEHVPPVVLSKVSSLNKELSFDKPVHQIESLTFDYKDYLIAFDFAALDYAQPHKNQYMYKLEGFDPDWIHSGTLNRATYTNLPSGSYKLRVKASNNDGVWNEEGLTINVRVNPAIWATWWAISAYAGVFCLLLIFVVRNQAKKLATREHFQTQVAAQVKTETSKLNSLNSELEKQVSVLRQQSLRDQDTGLPNQGLLSEVMSACTDLMTRYSYQGINSSTTQRMCLFLIKIPQLSLIREEQDKESANRVLLNFVQKLQQQSYQYQVVSRWGEEELAVIRFIDDIEDFERVIKQITGLGHQVRYLDLKGEQQFLDVAIGYSLYPLDTASTYVLEWDQLMMLTEHAMHSASRSKGTHWIGIIGLHKPLTAASIKQAMMTEDILEMSELFEFETDIEQDS